MGSREAILYCSMVTTQGHSVVSSPRLGMEVGSRARLGGEVQANGGEKTIIVTIIDAQSQLKIIL